MLESINEELPRHSHAQQSFKDIDAALGQYKALFGKQLEPLGTEPELSDYYTPTLKLKTKEMIAIAIGMGIRMYIAYRVGKDK